jgi:hypothetical protein
MKFKEFMQIKELQRSSIRQNIIKTTERKNNKNNITLLLTNAKSYDISNIMFVALSEIPLNYECGLLCVSTVVDHNNERTVEFSVYYSTLLDFKSPDVLDYISETHNRMMYFDNYAYLQQIRIEIYQT